VNASNRNATCEVSLVTPQYCWNHNSELDMQVPFKRSCLLASSCLLIGLSFLPTTYQPRGMLTRLQMPTQATYILCSSCTENSQSHQISKSCTCISL